MLSRQGILQLWRHFGKPIQVENKLYQPLLAGFFVSNPGDEVEALQEASGPIELKTTRESCWVIQKRRKRKH